MAKPFAKMRGLTDKQLMQGLGHQAMQQDLAAKVINFHGRVLIKLVVLGLVNAAATIYFAYTLLWR